MRFSEMFRREIRRETERALGERSRTTYLLNVNRFSFLGLEVRTAKGAVDVLAAVIPHDALVCEKIFEVFEDFAARNAGQHLYRKVGA